MGDFIQLVGVSEDRPVINKTGITGFIDYEIVIEPPGGTQSPAVENRAEGQNRVAVDDVNRAIVAAVQDQLGLKLESAKDKVDILVIDAVEKLSEN